MNNLSSNCSCLISSSSTGSFVFHIADPCVRYDCYGGTCTNERGVPRCICSLGRTGSRCQGYSINAIEKQCIFMLNFTFVFKTIFAHCIHVRTMVNVSLKEAVDVVFVHLHTMAMIVVKVASNIHCLHALLSHEY
jgi:hypothetical protein